MRAALSAALMQYYTPLGWSHVIVCLLHGLWAVVMFEHVFVPRVPVYICSHSDVCVS